MSNEAMSYENFVQEMQIMTQTQLHELNAMWNQMGVQKTPRMETVKQHIQESFETMIDEEKRHLDQLLKKIQLLEQERAGLLRELDQPSQNSDNYVTMSYVEIRRDLEAINQALKTEKEERMIEVNSLRKIDEDASSVVDMPSYPLQPNTLPSSKQMQELKSHIEEMKILKNDRFLQFEQLKSQVLELYVELDVAPNSTLERNIVCGGDIKLSSTNLNILENLLCTLQNHLEANKRKITKGMERIEVLCDRLKINDQERKEYLANSNAGWSDPVLKEVTLKLEKLEVLKLASIKQFVTEARKEIHQLWEQCLYGEEEKKAFTSMYSVKFNEEVLCEHEEEIERLKKYHYDNSMIFQHLKEFSRLWHKKIELDAKEKDPNRLFNRRKNNLAEEEAERRRIKKQLPKIEREMFDKVREHDSLNKKKFTIYGVRFEQYIEQKKAEHGNEADLEKNQKKDMRRKLIEHETIYGSTPMRQLTPMNVTSKTKKSASADQERHMKRLTTASSSQKASSVTKRAVPGNQLGVPRPKRLKMNDTSILSGNLHNTATSMESTTSYRDQEVISSTFAESKNNQKLGLRTPLKLASTPIAALTKINNTPSTNTPHFKTPVSTTRYGSSNQNKTKSGMLKSGRKIPFKI